MDNVEPLREEITKFAARAIRIGLKSPFVVIGDYDFEGVKMQTVFGKVVFHRITNVPPGIIYAMTKRDWRKMRRHFYV